MKLKLLLSTITASVLLSGCGFEVVSEGNVGVQRYLGEVDHEEVSPGLEFYNPFTTKFYEAIANEIEVKVDDMTPKAKDNLSMADLDMTVYYKADPTKISEIMVKYKDGSPESGGLIWPAYNVVFQVARESAYDAVATIDSLVMHQNRTILAEAIKERMNKSSIAENGHLQITRVVIRAANTDPQIEESIQTNIKRQKQLEAKSKEIEIAKADAQIAIEEARGVAEANNIINSSLTPEYLQHEQNKALYQFAKTGKNNTVVIPSNFNNTNLLIDTYKGSK